MSNIVQGLKRSKCFSLDEGQVIMESLNIIAGVLSKIEEANKEPEKATE